MKVSKYTFIIVIIFSLCLPQISFAITDDFPKLANYFLQWKIDYSMAQELAKWDVLVLDMQNQYTSESTLKEIKRLNPNISLLAYMTVEEVQDQHIFADSNNPWRIVYNEVERNNLWLRNVNGEKVSFWPGTSMIDVSNTVWQSWLPGFFKNNILINNYWDGIFLDNCFDGISWIDSSTVVSDSAWKLGMSNLLKSLDNSLEDSILVINSSSVYKDNINGRLYEGWPKVYTGNWQSNINDYFTMNAVVNEPKTIIINSNTNNQNNRQDYQMMRFGLTSTLLADGYYSFDYGDQNHAQTWWYDEYDQYLGKAINEPQNLLKDNSYGLWRRDFEQGTILINPSLTDHRIKLGGEFEKIDGEQDPLINDGSIVTSVNIPSQDGLIILRRSKIVNNAVFRNGSFAWVYDRLGNEKRNGFFVYDNVAPGNSKVVQVDLDSDGSLDKVISGDNWIDIYNKNIFVKRIYPYTEKYNQGINFTVGDLNGDGWVEIITGTERGGGPQIRVFSSDGCLINPGFFAYAKNFRGGVSVSVADTNNNGSMEIIAGAGYGGGPHVRIFDASGKLLSPGFMAFDPSFRGGVTVATADIDNDGITEIVTTPGRGGEAEVRVFNIDGQLTNQWSLGKADNSLGLELALVDLDEDGEQEIVTMTRNIFAW